MEPTQVPALERHNSRSIVSQALLSAAGADVTYRELEDLSHCYPREMNPAILSWLRGAS